MSTIARTRLPLASIVMQDRLREDLGDVSELAHSLSEKGLIQPIVVNQDLRLIAGGRRLTAAFSLGWTEIDVVFLETLSESHLKELELEENLRRKSMTWQEQCLSIARIHRLKVNEATTHGTDWGHRETAELFKIGKTPVTNALLLARCIENGHEKVRAAESVSDALKVLIQEKEDQAVQLAANRLIAMATPPSPISGAETMDPYNFTEPPAYAPAEGDSLLMDRNHCIEVLKRAAEKRVNLSNNFLCMDALAYLAQDRYQSQSVDAIITDPPYAIDMDNLAQENQGMANIDRVADTHDVEENLTLLEKFIPLAHNVLKDNGFMVLWCDLFNFRWLHDVGLRAGFKVQRWPLIWHKTSPCGNNAANRNFTKDHEAAIVFRKGNSLLAKPSHTSVITAPNTGRLSSHPFAKPAIVWDFIARHVCIPNSYILDPFMGVASSIPAFIDLGHRVGGCELDAIHHAHAIENLRTFYLSKDPGVYFV